MASGFEQIGSFGEGETITIRAVYEDWHLVVDDLRNGARLLEDEVTRIEQDIADPGVENGTVEANAPFIKVIRETIAKRLERAEAISKLVEGE